MHKLITKRRNGWGRGGLGGRGIPRQQCGGPPGPPEFQGRGNGPTQQPGSHGRGGYSVGAGARHGVSSYGGPQSQPLYPELLQAIPVPDQVPVSPPAAPHSEASSSQQPEMTQMEQDSGQLVLTTQSDETPPLPPPQSKSSMRLPERPAIGNCGKKISLAANHFLAQFPDKDIYKYDVSSIVLMILLVYL
jgi:eukaryotic translation initiation factor 2C